MKENKTKPKRLRNFLFLFAFIIGLIITYSIFQYQQGVSLVTANSNSNSEVDKDKFDDFEGVQPTIGEINVLLLGSDAREGEKDPRSDTLMIAHYDEKTNDVKIASIMRDTFVEIPGYGQHKINAAFSFGGPELVRQTIEENFDIEIHYYAQVDFANFPKVIDVLAPNGIEVNIESTMSHGIGMVLNPGIQTLHGEELLGYVRYRNDSKSDFGRVERQQEVLSKLKDETLSFNSIVNLPKLLGVVNSSIETNIDNKTVFTIGKNLLSSNSKGIETMSIPVKNSFEDKRVEGSGLVLSIDLEKNKQALKDFLSENANSISNETSNSPVK